LKRSKVRCAVLVEGANLTIDDGVRKIGCRACDYRKLGGPVEAFAGLKRNLAILDARLDAITVELYFVNPTLSRRWALQGLAKLRSYKGWRCISAGLGPSLRLFLVPAFRSSAANPSLLSQTASASTTAPEVMKGFGFFPSPLLSRPLSGRKLQRCHCLRGQPRRWPQPIGHRDV
jgi:hypothetical protein